MRTYRPWRQKTSPQLEDPDVDGVKEWFDTSGMEQERKMNTRNRMRASNLILKLNQHHFEVVSLSMDTVTCSTPLFSRGHGIGQFCICTCSSEPS